MPRSALTRVQQQPEVLIVFPPFGSAGYPAVGASVVAASCRRAGISARVYYANLLFAAQIGYLRYQHVATSSIQRLVGEAVFQAAAFGSDPDSSAARDAAFGGDASIPTAMKPDYGVTRGDAALCQRWVETFLEEAVDHILQFHPRIVGFSSVFQQNLATIAIMRRLKAIDPAIVTVLGGGNAAHPMGEAFGELVDACDVVFSGEADFDFPAFCEAVLAGEPLPEERVVHCAPVSELDETAVPEYADYYAQAAEFAAVTCLPDTLPDLLHFETSRGCWFGAKSHCKFCGLNGSEIGHRRKSTERIVDEIRGLVATYAPPRLSATDNIMPIEFRDDVLPKLEKEDLDVELFYEVKANLRESDLDQFVRAGVTMIQPGIESLSTNILKAMAKGVSAIQNIWLLRECETRGIQVYWNLLTGIPGETRDDYRAMLRILPLLEHLAPPWGVGAMRISRYSPYHTAPEESGIAGLRPLEIYGSLYPQQARIEDLAYYFAGDYRTDYLEDPTLQADLTAAIDRWSSRYASDPPPRLIRRAVSPDELIVEDSRACASKPSHVVSGAATDLLLKLDRPVLRHKLGRRDEPIADDLRKLGLVLEHEGRLVSVVTKPAKNVRLRERAESR